MLAAGALNTTVSKKTCNHTAAWTAAAAKHTTTQHTNNLNEKERLYIVEALRARCSTLSSLNMQQSLKQRQNVHIQGLAARNVRGRKLTVQIAAGERRSANRTEWSRREMPHVDGSALARLATNVDVSELVRY